MKTRLILTLDMDSPYQAADLVAVVGRGVFDGTHGAHLTDEAIGSLVRSAALVHAVVAGAGEY